MLTRHIPLVNLPPFHLPVLGVDEVMIFQIALCFLYTVSCMPQCALAVAVATLSAFTLW